jgi:hypothetical protein
MITQTGPTEEQASSASIPAIEVKVQADAGRGNRLFGKARLDQGCRI